MPFIRKILHQEKVEKNGKEILKIWALVEDDLGNQEEIIGYVGGNCETFFHRGQLRFFVKKG